MGALPVCFAVPAVTAAGLEAFWSSVPAGVTYSPLSPVSKNTKLVQFYVELLHFNDCYVSNSTKYYLKRLPLLPLLPLLLLLLQQQQQVPYLLPLLQAVLS